MPPNSLAEFSWENDPAFFTKDDPLIKEAREEIIKAGRASASLLQRRLKVGYDRAAHILDILEEEGFIGPASGASPRIILDPRYWLKEPETSDQIERKTKSAVMESLMTLIEIIMRLSILIAIVYYSALALRWFVHWLIY
jgi:hypothetical protein